MKEITEAKDVTIYKALLRVLGDYTTKAPMTGVDKLFQKAVDNGIKILPKDSKALEILSNVLCSDTTTSGVVQKLLNTRFSSLSIDIRPISKSGRKKEVAFWDNGNRICDKVVDLINFDGKAKGNWCDVDGTKVSLIDTDFSGDGVFSPTENPLP